MTSLGPDRPIIPGTGEPDEGSGGSGTPGEPGAAGEPGEPGVAGEPGVDSTVPGPSGEQGEQGDTGVGLATGGTTGQSLAKLSNADHDTGWIDTVRVVSHGDVAGTARPTAVVVYWVGTVEPTNATNNDLWIGGP